MTWLHVPSTSLASVPVPEASNSDSMPPNPEPELYVTLSGKPTPRPVSWRGWKTRPWITRLFGTTLPPSTLQRGVDSWISSLRETRASQTASPARDSEPTMTDGSPSISCASYRFSRPDPQTPGGQTSSKECRTLNPLFVEWLMGWPRGWTDLDSPATGWSLFRRRMRTELFRLCSQKPAQGSLFDEER